MEKLFGDYYIKEVSRKEFAEIFKAYHKTVFTEPPPPEPAGIRSKGNEKKKKALLSNTSSMQRLNLAIYHKKKVIGWMWGKQVDHETFYMVNTGIFPKYQGKGIYTALLEKLLSLLKDMGYEVVKSHHYINNNRVILAKLKQGFLITGVEISEFFGTLLCLTYFYNEKRREAYNRRVGSI